MDKLKIYWLVRELTEAMKADNQHERPLNQYCLDLLLAMPRNLRKRFVNSLQTNLIIVEDMRKDGAIPKAFKPKFKRGRRKVNFETCPECGSEMCDD